MGVAAKVAHEGLFIGVDLLRFSPIPGLEIAGAVLLNIWDALELVDVSFREPLSSRRAIHILLR